MKSLFFIFLPILCIAQSKQDYNWIMGYDMDQGIEGVEGGIISFENGSREIYTQDIGLAYMDQNTASISDEDGKLLFFTNGCQVFDSTFQLMTNGDSLNDNEWFDVLCDDGANGYQNTMILPDPGYDNGYYILHQPLAFLQDPFDLQSIDLRYSYVDMSAGLYGEVIEKNQAYFADTIGTSYFSACLHENGRDWWFVKQEYYSNRKYIFLLSEEGIALEHEIVIGDFVDERVSAGGQARFTPDGSMYITSSYFTGVHIYDFDRASGLLTNHQNFFIQEPILLRNGVEISPSGQFLYISYSRTLYQIDLWAADIEESTIVIDTFDGYAEPIPVTFGPLQLGPDCKIYMAGGSTVPFLHVINNPDERGSLCNFAQRGIELPWWNAIFSLPHFPHYRIDEEDICDPTITNLFGIPIVSKGVTIYPNPASDILYFSTTVSHVNILDIHGRLITQYTSDRTNSLDISNLLDGVYIVEYMNSTNVERQKIIKQ